MTVNELIQELVSLSLEGYGDAVMHVADHVGRADTAAEVQSGDDGRKKYVMLRAGALAAAPGIQMTRKNG